MDAREEGGMKNWILTWGLVYLHAFAGAADVCAYRRDGYRVRPVLRWSRFWRAWVYRGAKVQLP